ncbi:MAG: tRNA preQ1(34) S-adenosylmethionine ribosyltransferase-isomerase QueA [Planctomycetaceae bacterium]|nr:tRNA preQ1(34) S-adenosylmethionine ribosyltransferase-isomerase QueA [Planctomycetaceae bacterium]
MPDLDNLSAWQYDLPQHLIASRPAEQRDGARLMVVDRSSGRISHHQVRDLPDLLSPSDRLVFNNTKVIPARLFGFRTSTGGRWEGLFLNTEPDGRWKITGQTRGRLQVGETLTVIPALPVESDASAVPTPEKTLILTLTGRCEDGTWLMSPEDETKSFLESLEEFGTLPLPPYIGRKIADQEDCQRYQTVFASQPGAIAAPTAGLHFSEALLQQCQQRGIRQSHVTLHVGIGTFRPVSTERLSDHQMHSEWGCVSEETAQEIASTQREQGNVVAIGTTSVRTLEAASLHGKLLPWSGYTDLFIRPGYQFQTVDRLLTNFHLPGSTLLALVAALAGYETIMNAYAIAVAEKYRFFSYGDAMLIR